MTTETDPQFHEFAVTCVESMGDILWDFDPDRDRPLGFSDPRDIAVQEVENTLRNFAERIHRGGLYSQALRKEYARLVNALPTESGEDALIGALTRDSQWTARGAQTLVQLAQSYGAFVLRNALALAEAMKTEDGDSGL